ncbi:Glutathione S-transferase DHAR2 [Hordeum vulgare]|nr:Glutathione S-transferase DHAR2 [Hordeum vulgare]
MAAARASFLRRRVPRAHKRQRAAQPLAPRSLSLCLSRRRRVLSPSRAALSLHLAPPPPRRRSASGYRGVRQRPNSGFYAEIRSDDLRPSLGTYDTAHEAARAFDAAAWRLGRPRLQMNFPDVRMLQQALDLAPPPRLNFAQDRTEHTALQRRLLIAQEDERVMAEWRRRHPEDVAYEQEYWKRRRKERLDRRRRKALTCAQADLVNAGGRSFFTEEDERWFDIWLSTSDDTNDDDDGADD